jgi:DNA damage-binding protein 1
LQKLTEWNHNYFVTSLRTMPGNDPRLLVGDDISSISVLRRAAGDKLETVARDYSPLWPVALGAVGAESIVGANVDCSLFSFRLTRAGRLEHDGLWHADDQVNVFVDGAVVPAAAEGVIEPVQLFITSAGRVGVLSVVRDQALALGLIALERNMARVLVGIGGVNHNTYVLYSPAIQKVIILNHT